MCERMHVKSRRAMRAKSRSTPGTGAVIKLYRGWAGWGVARFFVHALVFIIVVMQKSAKVALKSRL